MTERPVKPLKRFWRRFRKALTSSPVFASGVASGLVGYLRLVKATNPLVLDSRADISARLAQGEGPFIFTCWHGQHFMVPFMTVEGHPSAMLVSKSADAELNAQIVRKAGIEVLRGSGGRSREQTLEKGGIRALMILRNKLRDGASVAFIADVPKGTARQAGMGVITLAKLSGRPIIPTAYASSRRKIFAKAWDKAALNLPFGRAAIVTGEPVFVARDATNDDMEAARTLLTERLNAITHRAYEAVDQDMRKNR